MFQETSDKCLESSNLLKSTIAKYGTVLGCLLEFNTIQQALTKQDQMNTRNLLQLINQSLAMADGKGRMRSLQSRQTSLASGLGPSGSVTSKH